jgi:hypothetical protein
MRHFRVLAATLAVLLSTAGAAWALSEAKMKPFDWPQETTFEFAIVDHGGARVATAYYRVLKETANGQPLYRYKYVGRNAAMSEASECWVYPDTLLPVRSTRKFVSNNRALFQDVAYGKGVIILRRKYDDSPVEERQIPSPSNACYDYESLMWIIPYLDFTGDTQLKMNVYSMITETMSAVVVSDLGPRELALGKYTYQAHCYSFSVGMVPYTYWSVLQDGRPVPARVDMDKNSFVNLKLDPKKVTAPKPAAQPKPEEKQGEQKKKEEQPEQPAKPGENPLGPPPPGSRF